MNKFTFRFAGKFNRGTDQKKAVANLAAAFAVSPRDLQPVLSGTHIFERNNLDAFTAKHYQELFRQYGAVGQIIPEQEQKVSPEPQKPTAPNQNLARPPAKKQTPENTKCPKCGSSNINKEQCHKCGIYFSKLSGKSPSPQVQTAFTREEISEQKYRHKAIRWLFGAGALMAAIGVVDNFFQSMPILHYGRIDFGYLPYILAHLVLLRGCFLFSKSKGYKTIYGILGLFSFAGLSLLLLLPDKNPRLVGSSVRQKVIASLCILFSLYWLAENLWVGANTFEFEQWASELADGRAEFPSDTLNSDPDLYHQEYKEIQVFINDTLDMLEENEYHSNKIDKIAGQMFQELARFMIWHNYQKYLHIKKGVELPAPLIEPYYEKYQPLHQIIEERVFSQRNQLSETAFSWFTGEHGDWDNPDQFWFDLKRILMDTEQKFRFLNAFGNRGSDEKPDLAQLVMQPHSKIHYTKTVDTITYTAESGPMMEYGVTLAYYAGPKTGKDFAVQKIYDSISPNESSVRLSRYVDVISFELPHYYLKPPYNVLSQLQQEYQYRKH